MHAEVDFGERLYFQGIVMDNQGLGVSHSLVLLLACFAGGLEKPLVYSFTDQEGRYLISIAKPAGCPGLLRYKVRANKLDLPSSIVPLDISPKELGPSSAAGTDQLPEIYCAACLTREGSDKVCQEINIAIDAENHIIELIDLTTAGEIGYHAQSAEAANEVANDEGEPHNKAAALLKKNEQLVDGRLLLLLLSLLGFAVWQKDVISCRIVSRVELKGKAHEC